MLYAGKTSRRMESPITLDLVEIWHVNTVPIFLRIRVGWEPFELEEGFNFPSDLIAIPICDFDMATVLTAETASLNRIKVKFTDLDYGPDSLEFGTMMDLAKEMNQACPPMVSRNILKSCSFQMAFPFISPSFDVEDVTPPHIIDRFDFTFYMNGIMENKCREWARRDVKGTVVVDSDKAQEQQRILRDYISNGTDQTYTVEKIESWKSLYVSSPIECKKLRSLVRLAQAHLFVPWESKIQHTEIKTKAMLNSVQTRTKSMVESACKDRYQSKRAGPFVNAIVDSYKTVREEYWDSVLSRIRKTIYANRKRPLKDIRIQPPQVTCRASFDLDTSTFSEFLRTESDMAGKIQKVIIHKTIALYCILLGDVADSVGTGMRTPKEIEDLLFDFDITSAALKEFETEIEGVGIVRENFLLMRCGISVFVLFRVGIM